MKDLMKIVVVLTSLILINIFCGCDPKNKSFTDLNLDRAHRTLDCMYLNYSIENTSLLHENYPSSDNYSMTYMTAGGQSEPINCSYLWSYVGTFSAVNILFEVTNDTKYLNILENKVLKGLEEYFDDNRIPGAYASYVRNTQPSDRYFDDNVWLGISFLEVYQLTQNKYYLQKALLLWTFIMSGMDDKLDGGIYWCEQTRDSKNVCANAPAAVFAFKLFETTGDSLYFEYGKELYEWTQTHLQDPDDHLYYDRIDIFRSIDHAKFSYNSGQMMQAAVLLYKLTGDEEYLKEAQEIALSCYGEFFTDFTSSAGESFKLLNKGDIWFSAVMMRGFTELYQMDGNKKYLEAYHKSLDYAWEHARDSNGLFNVDLSGVFKDESKWLLTQAAMVEMYARLAAIK